MKPRESLIDNVVCQLTDAILADKKWGPGERLPNERQLAEMFSISRNTVREAIKILNANHILITKPHSGTFVSESPGIDNDPFGFDKVTERAQMMHDLYELRIIIEGAAVQMVAQRATDEEIQEILSNEKICRELILADKPWSEADRKFHASIAEASHNTAFKRIIPSIHQSEYLGYNMMDENRNRENSLQYHPLIAESLSRRDEVGATMAIRYHLQRAIDDLRITSEEQSQEQHK